MASADEPDIDLTVPPILVRKPGDTPSVTPAAPVIGQSHGWIMPKSAEAAKMGRGERDRLMLLVASLVRSGSDTFGKIRKASGDETPVKDLRLGLRRAINAGLVRKNARRYTHVSERSQNRSEGDGFDKKKGRKPRIG
jgi:hypothetical protein